MYFLRALAFLFLTRRQLRIRENRRGLLCENRLSDTFEVTAQDVCVPGYAKKVRAVPAWLLVTPPFLQLLLRPVGKPCPLRLRQVVNDGGNEGRHRQQQFGGLRGRVLCSLRRIISAIENSELTILPGKHPHCGKIVPFLLRSHILPGSLKPDSHPAYRFVAESSRS
jgi:hypothetical protein